MSGPGRSLRVRRVSRPIAWLLTPAVVALQLVAALAVTAVTASSADAVAGPITLVVKSARDASPDPSTSSKPVVKKGDLVTKYKWLITKDDVGDPSYKAPAVLDKCLPFGAAGTTGGGVLSSYQPGDGTKAGAAAAAACQWPSTRTTAGALDVMASGDNTVAFPTLPDGKYLISVLADGYKLDGKHFVIAGDAPTVTVEMQPYPLPLGTLRLLVFADTVPVDGTYEAGSEQGLGGFIVHINDVMGEVTTDFYGNRLCTNYEHTKTLSPGDTGYTLPGDVPLAGYSRNPAQYNPNSPVVFDSTGAPVIDSVDPGGRCFTDATGEVAIPHIGPNRYTASTVGPQGQQWYQTTTLEGNHDWDMWIAEGDSGYDNELTVGGERVTPVQLGFTPWGYNANGTPKTVRALSRTTASPGPNRTMTLTLDPTSSTTLVAGQQIVVSGVGGGGFGGGFNGPHVITAVNNNLITFRVPGNGSSSGNLANATIATPDAGPRALTGPNANVVSGTIVELNSYIGGKGGVQNGLELNLSGANVRGPVNQPIVTLSDLGGNDQMVFVKRFGADGTFSIPRVPNGSYQLTYWDFEQNMIIDSFNVTVNGGAVNVGTKALVDWWTEVKGSVFVDANENGKRDAGETGVPQFLVALKQRDNSLLDAGLNSATTDANGDYVLRQSYPITKWMVEEAFNTRYRTTGVTVKADNEPTATTYLGAGVDINLLPVIGLSGRIDWGVKPYAGVENGGIAGTVTYDTTRNELDPAYAVTEPYQPGIPDMTAHLYWPLPCLGTEAPGSCSAGIPSAPDGYLLDPTTGAVQLLKGTDGKPLDLQTPYVSETWEASKGCQARMQDGNPLVTGVDQKALPPGGDVNYQCVEAPMTGWQAIPSDATPGAFGQTVNGNYAFADMNYDAAALDAEAASQSAGTAPAALTPLADPTALPNNYDFVVKVDSPVNANGKPIYKPTAEEDVNVFDGDVRMPQESYPLSADDVQAGAVTPPDPGQGGPLSQGGGFVAPCVGDKHTVHVTDAGFIGAGGSPYEGKSRNYCDSKLINIRGNQAVAPNFNFFTDVPLPTHFWGLTINDLGLSHDPTQIGYGEAQGLVGVPMGIYDYAGRLMDTVITDYNGMYEATEPSTSSYNCPLPAGPCPGMYYFKGNDPGQPGHPNKDYNPRFRTIGTNFQAWPGLYTVTDTAPTQVAQIALTPGSTQIGNVDCSVTPTTPDLMAVSTPYMQAQSVVTTNHVAQPKALTSIQFASAGGGGGGNSPRNVTLRITGAIDAGNLTGAPATVDIPTLTPANSAGLSAGQRTAINGNSNGTAIPGGRRYNVQSINSGATSTVVIRLNNVSNTGAVNNTGGATVTVTLAAFQTSVSTNNTTQTVVVNGTGFGATPQVTLTTATGTTYYQRVSAGSTDTQLTFTVNTVRTTPTSTATQTAAPAAGAYQLGISNAGKAAVNGLSFHILGTGYNPTLIEVNRPGAQIVDANHFYPQDPTAVGYDLTVNPETAIQRALDRAASSGANPNNSGALVVVWPGTPSSDSPTGDYYENLIVHSNVKIQGVGPGGFQGTTYVAGSRVNGLGFAPDNPQGTNWLNSLTAAGVADVTTVPDGAVVTVLGGSTFTRNYTAAIDGLTITGGAQQGQQTNVNAVTGGTTTPIGGPGSLVTQGGGVYVHTQATNLQVSNNIVVGNSGSYGGGVRIGTPYTATQANNGSWSVPNDQRNTGVKILHNRLRDNGGTNLAGGLAIFDGSDNYVVDHNDLCGNFSAEYGGGISHYGLSDGGKISFNRVYLNGSYDEGGGIMIAGELNPNLTQPSAGAATTGNGPGGAPKLTIDSNTVDRNLANDDGGGIRFLSAGNAPITVTNNFVTNNLSTHEGGGLALDDSTNLTIVGNTVARNITTATAVTSDGKPAPAGLSTAGNSTQLQATLPNGSATYSRPTLRNNIFSANLAGNWNSTTQLVEGITPGAGARYWDIGSVETLTGTLIAPTNSVLQTGGTLATQVTASPTNTVVDDAFVAGTTASSIFTTAFNVGVVIETSRTFPSFRQAVLVATSVGAPDSAGDYHLTATSPARGRANNAFPSVPVFPSTTGTVHDVDNQGRPQGGYDAGADEVP